MDPMGLDNLFYTPWNKQPTPLQIGRLPPKGNESSSNHPFSGAFAVCFRGCNRRTFKSWRPKGPDPFFWATWFQQRDYMIYVLIIGCFATSSNPQKTFGDQSVQNSWDHPFFNQKIWLLNLVFPPTSPNFPYPVFFSHTLQPRNL